MSTRTVFRLAAAVTFALAALSACGDVNTGLHHDGHDGHHGFWDWTMEPENFAEKTFATDVPVGGRTRLRLEAENGEVRVTGRPDANSVGVSARLRVGTDGMVNAEPYLDSLQVLVTELADEVLVQTVQPENPGGVQYLVAYTITVPADLAVAASQANGDITVEGVGSAVSVEAANGTVSLAAIVGSVNVTVGNGAIDGEVTLPPNGELRFTTTNGNQYLTIPKTTSAVFSASVGTGSVTAADLVFTNRVQTDRSLTGTLGSGEGVIELTGSNGIIAVTGSN